MKLQIQVSLPAAARLHSSIPARNEYIVPLISLYHLFYLAGRLNSQIYQQLRSDNNETTNTITG